VHDRERNRARERWEIQPDRLRPTVLIDINIYFSTFLQFEVIFILAIVIVAKHLYRTTQISGALDRANVLPLDAGQAVSRAL